MFRPSCSPTWLPLVAAVVLLPGCQAMYRDVYTPHGNHFKPPEKKRETLLLPDEASKPVGGVIPGGAGVTPEPGIAPPPPAPAGIPGLEMPPPPPPAN